MTTRLSPSMLFVSLALTALFATVFLLKLPVWPSWVLWCLGVTVGWLGWWLDSTRSRQLYQGEPITMSLVFWLVALPLSIFVVTSTPYWFGKGVVLGWLTAVLIEIIPALQQPEQFHRQYLYQLKQALTANEQRVLVAVMAVAWLFLSIGSWL